MTMERFGAGPLKGEPVNVSGLDKYEVMRRICWKQANHELGIVSLFSCWRPYDGRRPGDRAWSDKRLRAVLAFLQGEGMITRVSGGYRATTEGLKWCDRARRIVEDRRYARA